MREMWFKRHFEAVDVFHEVEAEQEIVVEAESLGYLEQELGAGRRQQVADRAPEERDKATAPTGNRSQVVFEVADHRVHGH